MTDFSLADLHIALMQPQKVGKRLQAPHVPNNDKVRYFFLNEQEKCVTPPPLCLLEEREF